MMEELSAHLPDYDYIYFSFLHSVFWQGMEK